jgi:hypothetical protein
MTKVTVGQILDLFDDRRESDEIICVMGNNGKAQCRAMVCSEIWSGLEDRTVKSIQAEGDALKIWLGDK